MSSPRRSIPIRASKPTYDCTKCPAYCCSYPRIAITARDIARLAAHFGITPAQAEERFTKCWRDERILRHRVDHIYESTCMFLDQDARRCTIYAARPSVCREYPDKPWCGYYEFLRFEREHQNDESFIPTA